MDNNIVALFLLIIPYLLIGIIITGFCLLLNYKKQKRQQKYSKWSYYQYNSSPLKSRHISRDEYIANCIIPSMSSHYKVKHTLMNDCEQKIYYYINQILDELSLTNYFVFPQVSLTSFIDTLHNKNYYTDWNLYNAVLNSITSKSIDFLICKKDTTTYQFSPVIAIEYDGSGHSKDIHQQNNDIFKNNLFGQLGFQFFRIPDTIISKTTKENIKASLQNRLCN